MSMQGRFQTCRPASGELFRGYARFFYGLDRKEFERTGSFHRQWENFWHLARNKVEYFFHSLEITDTPFFLIKEDQPFPDC
jgi:hypothetical protein